MESESKERHLQLLQELHIGDIAFLATVLGMEGDREAHHCLLHAAGAKIEFCCTWEDCVSKQRNQLNMRASLLKCLHRSQTNKSLKNIDAVNNHQLLSTGANNVLVPILHCPMGLVSKVLEIFLDFVWRKVFLLPPKDDLKWKKL
jgi:hypothetical protein